MRPLLFAFAERAARAHVRDDDHRRGVLDRVRAGHHHQAARQVPQRQDRQREGKNQAPALFEAGIIAFFLKYQLTH